MSFGAHIPFVESLGLVLSRFEDGHSTIDYVPRPEHLNSFAVTHGGVVMTLLDVAMASAARSVQPEMGVVTIEMKTSFMRPAPGDGTPLSAHGSLLHRTGRMAFTEARVLDAQGQLCAHATGTFKYQPRQIHQAGVSTD
jgi:uncharacterized protein (TIGR00369 family)